MTRTVMCRKHKQELPGLDRPPYPGAKGEDIYQHVSRLRPGRGLRAPQRLSRRLGAYSKPAARRPNGVEDRFGMLIYPL